MKRIHLISGPRNISTSLMYSFNNRADCIAVDEPFYAYYLHKTNVRHPGREEVLDSQSTNEKEVIEKVIFQSYEVPILFIKNMASHLWEMEHPIQNKLENIFLIRNTNSVIHSFSKVVPNLTLKDIGIKEEYLIYQQLVEKGHRPPVVDSSELVKNPEAILTQLCHTIQIPFSQSMLQWPRGPKDIDGVWAKYWYANTHKAKTFAPFTPAQEIKLDSKYHALAEEANQYYQQLFKHALKV